MGGTLDLASPGRRRARRGPAPGLEVLADVGAPRLPAGGSVGLSSRRRRAGRGSRRSGVLRADLIFRVFVYGAHPYARDPAARPATSPA
ncbi:MAG: hypothetical protein U0794_02575 [Isosphaeraceae bacterium]